MKSADGVTDIYGVMYKPYDFDPNKKYPIVAYVYPGPQTESVSKFFSTNASEQALAQFGFIVITVGNRGGHPDSLQVVPQLRLRESEGLRVGR